MTADGPFRRVLVVDLLGGLGDLLMVLPAVHALARRHAPVRVLTHAPGDALLRHDPAVSDVEVARRGAEPDAVCAALDRWRPDLVVSTTRYGGIPELIESRGVRCVTNLWRHPPADEPVGRRYLAVLAAERLVDHADVDGWAAARLALTPEERHAGATVLAAHTTSAGRPVVLLPGAGMAVKVWPYWRELAGALAARGTAPLVAGEPDVLAAWRDKPPPGTAAHAPIAVALPRLNLRELAAVFAAVADRDGVVVGPDTGPLRVAAAAGARTTGIFGPTLAARYGLGPRSRDLQGLPGCPHRRPTAITEQVCWWEAHCPLGDGPACLADVRVEAVLAAVTAPPPARR